MNHKFKMRQRVTALCMAAMMCCGMLPYGALAEDSARPVVVATPEQAATQEAKSESDANSTATPETADESPDEDLRDFVTVSRRLGLRIDDIESNPAYVGSGLSVYTITVTICSSELKKYKTHHEIIEALKSLDYIYHLEELR